MEEFQIQRLIETVTPQLEAQGCAASISLPGGSKSPIKTAPQRSSKRKAPASGKTFRKNAREQNLSRDYCAITTCGVAYESPRDLFLKKDRQYEWIGCDEECGYWVHARCAGIIVPPKKRTIGKDSILVP